MSIKDWNLYTKYEKVKMKKRPNSVKGSIYNWMITIWTY